MFDNNNPRIVRSTWAGVIGGAMLLVAAATPAAAQSYDPDLGAGNTAPPGITYGGGLREGRIYGGARYGSTYGRYRSVFSHRAQVVQHRTHHARHHHAR
jgi:hypothetical protein